MREIYEVRETVPDLGVCAGDFLVPDPDDDEVPARLVRPLSASSFERLRSLIPTAIRHEIPTVST